MMSVGIDITPYSMAMSWLSSTLHFATEIFSASSSATCSTTGASARQGPHQGAQKSTSTGLLLLMMPARDSVVTSAIDAMECSF